MGIYQMGSEDCWLLSMISALVVHHPEHFTKMIRENESGLYEVDFFPKEKKETITVDSFFPKTKFEKAATVFWPLIIEKAMVRYFDDKSDAYDVLEGGNGKESFYNLTSYCAKDFELKDKEPDFATLKQYWDMGYPIQINEEEHADALVGMETRDGIDYVRFFDPNNLRNPEDPFGNYVEGTKSTFEIEFDRI